MNITFPTQAGKNTKPGTPRRADPCCCLHGPVVVDLTGTCIFCGHFELETIQRTWHDRARQLAERRGRQFDAEERAA